MNVFKFANLDGRYLIAIPYKKGWLVLEEKKDNTIIQYRYVPGFKAKVQSYQDGNRRLYIYGSWRLYLKHCFITYPPAWATMGCTLR
jgi:hypothetical protein